MNIGRKLFTTFVLAFAFVGLNTVASAQDTPKPERSDSMRREGRGGKEMRRGMRGGGRDHGRKRGGRGRGMQGLRGITLNDSQKQKIQALFQAKRTEKQPPSDEIRELMMAKRNGLLTTAQEQRLQTIRTERMAARKAEMDKMNASIRSILTAEQQTQYDKNLAEAKQRMEERKTRMEEHKKKRMENKKDQPKP